MVIVEVAPGLKKEIGWLYMKHFISIKSSRNLATISMYVCSIF